MNTTEDEPKANYQIQLIFRVKVGLTPEQVDLGGLTDCAGRLKQLAESFLAEEFNGSPILVSATLEMAPTPLPPKRSRRTAVRAAPPKKQLILELLGRDEGATMEDLQHVTGWGRNTISAQLTYLAKLGSPIERDRGDGVLRYRLEQ